MNNLSLLTKIPEYMPKFDGDYKALTDVSFFLYQNKDLAESGSAYGSTGFIVSIPSAVSTKIFIYAVTNRHCIDGGDLVLRFNKKDGSLATLETKRENWIWIDNHYDVAVMPIAIGEDIVWKGIDTSFFATEQDEIDTGEDCFMVGRFVNYDGGQNSNRPSMRFGNISIAQANIIHPHSQKYPQLKYKAEQQAILLDMRARTGYSGNPVFAHRTQGSLFYKNAKEGEQKRLVTYHFMKLMGIQWGIIPDDVNNNVGSFSEEIAHANPKNADDLKNMSIVCPAKYILEALNKPELKNSRDETNKKLLEARKNNIQLTTQS